jgi:hypothetical protein
MIMGNADLRKKYAQRARTYVKKKISWSITAKKHMQIYKKAEMHMKQGKRDLISEAFL